MLKKDKQKVIGEELSNERIKAMLDLRDEQGGADDFHLLTRAYRALRAGDFARFIEYFCAAGHDLNATNTSGQTFLQVVSQHDQAAPYVSILKTAGAK